MEELDIKKGLLGDLIKQLGGQTASKWKDELGAKAGDKVECPKCGAMNSAGAMKCKECGADLEGADDESGETEIEVTAMGDKDAIRKKLADLFGE